MISVFGWVIIYYTTFLTTICPPIITNTPMYITPRWIFYEEFSTILKLQFRYFLPLDIFYFLTYIPLCLFSFKTSLPRNVDDTSI